MAKSVKRKKVSPPIKDAYSVDASLCDCGGIVLHLYDKDGREWGRAHSPEDVIGWLHEMVGLVYGTTSGSMIPKILT